MVNEFGEKKKTRWLLWFAVFLLVLAGKHVALIYEQHKGLPTSCFGDTEYFIVDVRAVQ